MRYIVDLFNARPLRRENNLGRDLAFHELYIAIDVAIRAI
jgi:hypothetical protein